MAVAWKQGRLRGPQLPKAGVDILCSAQLLKDWDQVQQLGVCHVIKPRLHRHLGQGKGGVNLLSVLPSLAPEPEAGWVHLGSCAHLISLPTPSPPVVGTLPVPQCGHL